jgi:hypothetical protein
MEPGQAWRTKSTRPVHEPVEVAQVQAVHARVSLTVS